MSTPLSILHESIKAVPAVKYALGVAGIASAVAIVRSINIDPGVAVLGIIIMFALMAMLVLFARLTKLANADFRLPALVFTWSALFLMISVAFGMLSSVFFQYPIKDLRSLLDPDPVVIPDKPVLPEQPILAEDPTASRDGAAAKTPEEIEIGGDSVQYDCKDIPFTDFSKTPPETTKINNCG